MIDMTTGRATAGPTCTSASSGPLFCGSTVTLGPFSRPEPASHLWRLCSLPAHHGTRVASVALSGAGELAPALISEGVFHLGEAGGVEPTQAADWLKRVADTGQPVVITQNGKAAGVLVSPSEFDRLCERAGLREAIDAGLRNRSTFGFDFDRADHVVHVQFDVTL